MAQDITLQQAQQNPLLNSILAPYFQPGATLQETQAQIPQTQQSTQTSAAEQANLQASNPGIQASSQTQQVEALQKKAQLGLSASLSKGMDLPTALKTYTALGMKPDDIFSNYLSQRGLPDMSPTELQSRGVTPTAIGKIGDNGSFADKWNTKQAVLGMRDLHDKWNTVNGLSKLGIFGLGVSTPSSQGYDAQRQFLGQHLSSLVPGSPGGQGPAGDLMNQIPDVGHITETEPGAADQRFNGAEQGLLNVKGYSYKDLGLMPNTSQNTSSQIKQRPDMKGGELLQNILNDTKGIASNTVNTGSQFLNKVLSGENPSTATGDMAVQMGKGAIQNYANILGIQAKNGQLSENPNEALQYITQHPVTTALSVLPFLAGKGGAVSDTGDAGGAIAAETPKAPPSATAATITKPRAPGTLKTALNPNSSRDAGFALKANAIKTIKNNNDTVNGDTIVNHVTNEAEALKDSFPNVPEEDIDNWVKNIQNRYGGKQLDPSDAEKRYNTTPSDKTATGLQKERLADHQNGILRDAISTAIEQKAPGAGWQEGVQAQAKAYQAAKGQPAKIVKNLPYNATKALLNVTGLGFLREFMGG